MVAFGSGGGGGAADTVVVVRGSNAGTVSNTGFICDGAGECVVNRCSIAPINRV